MAAKHARTHAIPASRHPVSIQHAVRKSSHALKRPHPSLCTNCIGPAHAQSAAAKTAQTRQRRQARVARGEETLNAWNVPVRNSRGAALTEMALVLPLFLIVLVSIIDFGIYSFDQHTLQFATREGVRLALVGRTLTDQSGNQLTREASIIKTIHDCATVAVDPTQLEISIFPVNTDYTDPNDWQTTQNAGGPGSFMRVRTRYRYKFITPLVGALFPDGKILITSQATYRNERF